MILASIVCAGCSTAGRPIPVAVVSDNRAALGPLTADAVGGLDLQPVELPQPPPSAASTNTPTLARARVAYSEGEFDACRRELGTLDLGDLLARGARDPAARWLAYEAACAFGAQAKAEATTAANTLARLGLEMPDVALAGDVEAAIEEAIAMAGTIPLRSIAVTGETGARLSVDGLTASCTLPCTVQIRPGSHLFAVESDGFLPSHRWVDITEASTLALPQEAAPPALAGQHWHSRIGRGLPPTDPVGARLLARVAGERVAFVHASAERGLSGWMIVGGKVVASATRDPGETLALLGDLAYDGGVLQRPAVWKRPWFWIAVSTAALVAAGAIVVMTYEPETITTLVVQ